jgi:hypothetical protein
MGLPCAFTKQLRIGDHVMVCEHVFETNLRDGYLLSCFRGRLHRDSPAKSVQYPDGTTGKCDVVITCGQCDPQGQGIDLREFCWKAQGLFSVGVGAPHDSN